MSKVLRWVLRLGVLFVFAVIWYELPYLMVGPSRLLSALHLAALVAGIDLSLIVLVLTVIPYSRKRQDLETMRRHVQRQERTTP